MDLEVASPRLELPAFYRKFGYEITGTAEWPERRIAHVEVPGALCRYVENFETALAPAELALDRLGPEVDERWTAVGTGARGGRPLEVLHEAPHFVHREEHAGADAAVAGNCRRGPAEGVGHALLAFELLE